jgi:hypothetical protein
VGEQKDVQLAPFEGISAGSWQKRSPDRLRSYNSVFFPLELFGIGGGGETPGHTRCREFRRGGGQMTADVVVGWWKRGRKV